MIVFIGMMVLCYLLPIEPVFEIVIKKDRFIIDIKIGSRVQLAGYPQKAPDFKSGMLILGNDVEILVSVKQLPWIF
jgi:hypothetical protein